jgi:hypothetical protein
LSFSFWCAAFSSLSTPSHRASRSFLPSRASISAARTPSLHRVPAEERVRAQEPTRVNARRARTAPAREASACQPRQALARRHRTPAGAPPAGLATRPLHRAPPGPARPACQQSDPGGRPPRPDRFHPPWAASHAAGQPAITQLPQRQAGRARPGSAPASQPRPRGPRLRPFRPSPPADLAQVHPSPCFFFRTCHIL